MDKLNTRQAVDDRRYVDPADLICPPSSRGVRFPPATRLICPRLHRASPLRTARLLARGVGPARGRLLPRRRDGPVPGAFHRPPGRTGRNRQGVSGCGREEATAVGLPRTPRTPAPRGADTGETSWRPYSAAPGGWVYPRLRTRPRRSPTTTSQAMSGLSTPLSRRARPRLALQRAGGGTATGACWLPRVAIVDGRLTT